MTAHRAELERRIASGDPDLVPWGLVDLGVLHVAEGRPAEAEEALRAALETGHPSQAPRAAFELAMLLEARGEPEAAAEAYAIVLAGGVTEYAGPAVCGMRRLRR
ncbi:MAG TPA: tetratricopeptide repeat protein [Miltoncostaeaceae bacterium]|nr:tetratricopeptide repeat protein [Miltoncostaeaceae bacterium]